MQWFSHVADLVGAGKIAEPALAPPSTLPRSHGPSQGDDATFNVGETVEYYSSSTGTWITAKVLAVNPRGTYNLDCKPDVAPEKIRREDPFGTRGNINNGSADMKHAVGDVVEYHSSTHGWIAAKVLSLTPKGTYNLDCKPDVVADKVRSRSMNFQPNPRKTLLKQDNSHRVSFGEGGFKPEGALAAIPRIHKPAAPSEPPVQLLRVQRQGQGRCYFEVCNEGVQRLERYGNRRIAVVSVCGPRRTGKSSLLNLFSDGNQIGASPLAGSGRNGSEGLWLSSTATGDDDSGPIVAYLDCEGITDSSDNNEQARSAQLLTLCGLLSSVLVLNTKGTLNDGLLQNIGNSCKFPDYLDAGSVSGTTSHAALIWVLRDFMLELRDSSGRQTTPDEYLEKALSTSGSDLRQRIRGFFSRQSCVTLVPPSSQQTQLENLPYSSLKSEFRAGVEALQAQLAVTCRANPKMVGGHPLSCVAFVALLKQVLASVNNQLPLSLKNAWETAQHGTCGMLADELRGIALVTLKTLQAGEKVSGGAQLPMSDEALRMLLRQQRHELKAQWDERAVGEESVRREYWQELKESFARDERMVIQQNAKLADLRLKDALHAWQCFLDADQGNNSYGESGEHIAAELGSIMERTPTTTLTRAARSAIEAAGRQVAAARSGVWAAQAGHRSSPTYNASGSAHPDVELRDVKSELQSQQLKLQDAKMELEKLLADAETARVREQDLRSHQREFAEKESAWRAELEHVHVSAAQAEADHLHSERLLKTQNESLRSQLDLLERGNGGGQNDAEKTRLRAELERLREHAAAKGEVEAELEALRTAQATERERLEQELSCARTHAASKGMLEADLERVQAAQATERAQLEEELQKVRGHAAERSRIEADLEQLRASQAAERQRLEDQLQEAREQAAQKGRLEAELEQARMQATEHMKLQAELKRVQAEAQDSKSENEKACAEHLRMVEEAQQRLEEERRTHADKLGGERGRLLERERDAGVLEGRVDAISAEADTLRKRVAELQQQVEDAEGQKGQTLQEQDKLRQQAVKSQDDLRKVKDEYERKLEEAARKRQAKCGCSVM